MSRAKDDFIAKTVQYWNPGKTLEWQRVGVDLMIAAVKEGMDHCDIGNHHFSRP